MRVLVRGWQIANPVSDSHLFESVKAIVEIL